MKRIRVCATVLGLLTCAVVASAETVTVTTTVTQNGNPVQGADVYVNGVKQPGTTDSSGSLQMILDLGNNPNKTLEITVEECNGSITRTYVSQPGTQTPAPAQNCQDHKAAEVIPIYGDGRLVIQVGPGWTVTGTFTPAAGAPTVSASEGPPPVNVGFAGNLGMLNDPKECNVLPTFSTTGSTLPTSTIIQCNGTSKAAVGGGSFWICISVPCFTVGVIKSGNVNLNQSVPGLSASTAWNVFGGMVGGILPVLSADSGKIVGTVNGGIISFTATVTQTIVITTTPTPGVTPASAAASHNATNDPTKFGGVGHYWGGTAGYFINKHIAATFSVTRMILPSGSISQSANMYTGGVLVVIAPLKTLFKIGHEK